MELIEREPFLDLLQNILSGVEEGEGHCVFVIGEAGIGKTSLIDTFCKKQHKNIKIFKGLCDPLFTPRLLAPFYDIALQMKIDWWEQAGSIVDRSRLFAKFFQELSRNNDPVVMVFEDIHWADDATFDFIKFIVRRISQLRCLFILSYRDDGRSVPAVRNMLAELPADRVTRLALKPLSKEAVGRMAEEKGFNGDEVYGIAGGNPFYVTEILSSYSLGVPESIRDAILSAYHRTEEDTREVWDFLSVIPTSFEIKYIEKFDPYCALAIENCLHHHILIIQDGFISFKHELFRKTIEAALSPMRRTELNKKVLRMLQASFDRAGDLERIIHHAKAANEYDTVFHYAPLAAKQAALLGSHTQSAQLYLSAIQYYQGTDEAILLPLYESYAYECYLTNQVKEAILYTSKSLKHWQEKGDPEKIAGCFFFLSRLWWIDDDLKNAEFSAIQAIETLEHQPASGTKALAYALLSQLKMLSDLSNESIFWGEKAIAMAKKVSDRGVVSYALGSIGSMEIRKPALTKQGIEMLQESLGIALEHSYPDYAGMAYVNLGYNGIIIKNYALAKEAVTEGLRYSEENSLDLWRLYLLTLQAKLCLETGEWKKAYELAQTLTEDQRPGKLIKIFTLTILATIEIRTGREAPVLSRLKEAMEKAFETTEPQRILQALTAFLEYEWIRGEHLIDDTLLESAIVMTGIKGNIYGNSEFAFWLKMSRGRSLPLRDLYADFDLGILGKAEHAARSWKQKGCQYYAGLALFAGGDADKREALNIMQSLGAEAVYQKMKQEMRTAGIRGIPRGLRKTTKSNAAQLTVREVEVLQLMKEGLQNKEIAARLYLSVKTVDHHISSILFKLDANTRVKAVNEALKRGIFAG